MQTPPVPSPAVPDKRELDALADLVQGAVLGYDVDAGGRALLVYASPGCTDLWGLTAEAMLADEAAIWLMAPRDQRRMLRNAFLEGHRHLRPRARAVRDPLDR